MMRRREFIAVLGASAIWPMRLLAQSNVVKRIAVLMPWDENDPEIRPRLAAIRAGLRQLGWVEGTNVELIFRWAAGNTGRIETFASELVAMRPDVILASTTPTVAALARATSSVPIVFVMVVDPVGQGIVRSLSNPGGNFTGFTHFEFSMSGKWFEFLKDAAPPLAKLGVIFNPQTAPYHAAFFETLRAPALSSSVEPVSLPARNPTELENSVSTFAQNPNGGLLVLPDTFTTVNRKLIISLAEQYRLPTIYPLDQFTVQGGLISYGPDLVDLYERAPQYVDRILKGAAPADLPVQQPTKFELVINMTAAKAVGVTFPVTLLARADRVIE